MPETEPSNIALNAQRTANVDHAWTLVRWIGIPLILVGAIYFVQRKYDERPFVVVTDHGAMPSPGQIAMRPPETPPETPPTPPTASVVPPVPVPPAAVIAARPAAPEIVLHPISRPSPDYPPRAVEAEKEGVVRLRLTLSPDGRVADAVAIRAQPAGWFERAAETGARRWRYAPSGRVLTTEVDVEFKLN